MKSVKEMDAEQGFAPQQDDSSVPVPGHLVRKYHPVGSGGTAERTTVGDGNW